VNRDVIHYNLQMIISVGFKIKKRYLHSVEKFPLISLKRETENTYTVAVICGDSWLDSCDVVVPIRPLSSYKGLPHEENQIEIQEEDSLVRYA
jgi:hypothetical protein